MERIEYYPLGSVVTLNDGTQKLLICARGLNVAEGDGIVYFDYGAVPYPNGLTGDRMAYFNHEAIARVFFTGYQDDDNAVMVDALNNYVADNKDKIKRHQF